MFYYRGSSYINTRSIQNQHAKSPLKDFITKEMYFMVVRKTIDSYDKNILFDNLYEVKNSEIIIYIPIAFTSTARHAWLSILQLIRLTTIYRGYSYSVGLTKFGLYGKRLSRWSRLKKEGGIIVAVGRRKERDTSPLKSKGEITNQNPEEANIDCL